MALILHADGRYEDTQPDNGTDFRLQQLHQIVAGPDQNPNNVMIEIVGCRDGRIIVINEEGKLLGLPPNKLATALANLSTPKEITEFILTHPTIDVIVVGDIDESNYIVGDVLVCESDEVQ